MYNITKREIIKNEIRDEYKPLINESKLLERIEQRESIINEEVKMLSSLIKSVNNHQIRRLYNIFSDTNSKDELMRFIDEQIDREISTEFYKQIKERIGNYKDQKNLIYTFLYEILLYKKALEEK